MKNDLIFERERLISSAFIDSSLRLGIAEAALLMQDNLTECFSHLQCDGILYREKYNAFWVFTKMKLTFTERPRWLQSVKIATFPVSNEGMRTNINTAMYREDGMLFLAANLEACALDLTTHRPIKLASLPYPTADFPEPVFTEPFERFGAEFSEQEHSFDETIRSQQIDMSRHMNNIEYIKCALNVFSYDFLQSHDVQSIEVHYAGESREGQILRVYRHDEANGSLIIIRESGRTVFKMKIIFR